MNRYKHTSVSFFIGFAVLFFIYHLPEFYPALWLVALCKIGILPIAYVIARMQGWQGLGGYGLAWHRGWLFNMFAGLLTGFLFFGLSVVLSFSLGWEQLVSAESFSKILTQIPLLLAMSFFPSLAEDILTRGYLYGHLQQRMPARWLLIFSSLIYVSNHIWRYTDGLHVLTYLFILGLALAWAVMWTQSFWLAFGLHWGLNIGYGATQEFLHTETLTEGSAPTWLYAGCLLLMFAVSWALKKYWYRSVWPKRIQSSGE